MQADPVPSPPPARFRWRGLVVLVAAHLSVNAGIGLLFGHQEGRAVMLFLTWPAQMGCVGFVGLLAGPRRWQRLGVCTLLVPLFFCVSEAAMRARSRYDIELGMLIYAAVGWATSWSLVGFFGWLNGWRIAIEGLVDQPRYQFSLRASLGFLTLLGFVLAAGRVAFSQQSIQGSLVGENWTWTLVLALFNAIPNVLLIFEQRTILHSARTSGMEVLTVLLLLLVGAAAALGGMACFLGTLMLIAVQFSVAGATAFALRKLGWRLVGP